MGEKLGGGISSYTYCRTSGPKACYKNYHYLIRLTWWLSLPLAEGSVPKPKRYHARNETHEIGVEDRPKIVNGDAFLIDDQPFDDDEIGHHRSH